MKLSPQDQKLTEMLRSSALVADGFMGHDSRSVADIIQADADILSARGLSAPELARKMRELTALAKTALGDPIEAQGLLVSVEEYKGTLPCPWGHPGRYAKRVTTAENPQTGISLSWSDLNVHLIEAHGFFEGKGAAFRVEPEEAVNLLFDSAT